MSLIFRLEDSHVFSNLHSLSKRCILTTSPDNQLCLALLDKVYVFKYEQNYFKLSSKLSSSSIPPNQSVNYNQLISQHHEADYYNNLQKLMCMYCVADSPRFVWTCWTPKIKLKDGKNVCLLCTITINNLINLWLPSDKEVGADMYNIDTVLNLSDSLRSSLIRSKIPVFGDNVNQDYSNSRLLFNLTTMGFPSCQFMGKVSGMENCLLCAINLYEHILFVWISTDNISGEDEAKNEESTRRRGARERKRINFEELEDFYEEEEPVKKKKKKGSQKIFGLTGFNALNKDFYDLDDFDINKCKDLVPASTKVTQSLNPLYCKPAGALSVCSCFSFVALPLTGSELNLYYSDLSGLKRVNINLRFSPNVLTFENSVLGGIFDVFQTNGPVECLKHNTLFGDEIYHVITGFYNSSFLVHFISKNLTRVIMCDKIPIYSYSIEPLFMVHGSLARVNLINSDGSIYRVLINHDLNLEIEEVVDRKDDFVPFFSTSSNEDVMVYDCLLNSSVMEVKYNLGNKSVFLNLVFLLHRNLDPSMFLDFVATNRKTLFQNSTVFTVLEESNPFHSLKSAEDILEATKSNDKFLTLLNEWISVDDQDLKKLFVFTLYLVSFIETCDALPFDQTNTVLCNENLHRILPKLLGSVSLKRDKLLAILKMVGKLYKNDVLSQIFP